MNKIRTDQDERIVDHLKDELPEVCPEDVVTLINLILALEEEKSFFFKKTENPLTIDDWMPHRSTILEVLRLAIDPAYLSTAIDGFKQYAADKHWPLDILEAKFITHVKHLVKAGRVPILSEENTP
jgi:hypothetical protein